MDSGTEQNLSDTFQNQTEEVVCTDSGTLETIEPFDAEETAITPTIDSTNPAASLSALSPDQLALQKSRALWRVLSPVDQSDPVAEVDKAFRVVDGYPRLIGASRRGRAHAHDGKYREDSFAIALTEEWMLAAVADGAGSKPLARVGAHFAAHEAIAYLQQKLKPTAMAANLEKHLRSALAGAMANALTAITAEATRREREVNDFSTTLILVAYHLAPDHPFIGWAQVGDGGVVVQRVNGECFQITQPDRGAHAGETLFLTSHEAQLTWGTRSYARPVTQPIHLIAVGTDGVLDDFTPPLGTLENLFESLSSLVEASRPDEQLLEWLNYERRGSFDDRTLLVLMPPAPLSKL